MKCLIVFLFIVFSTVSFYPQQFHSLDGIEDEQGNTQLLYRLGEQFYIYNPIYKFNTNTLEESLLIQAFHSNFPGGELAKAVLDFEFFPNDANNFMNVGYEINPDNHSYIARNDTIVFGGISGFDAVDISKQNSQKVFAFGGGAPVRSWDGGLTFPLDSIPAVTNFIPLSLADFDDEVMFGFDENSNFCKNGVLIDTSWVVFDRYSKLLYDVNQFHIYRVNKTYGGYSFNVSNNKGNFFTWTKTFQSSNPIYVTIDSTLSGVVYLADGRQIYKSSNNGYNFTEYKSLPSKLIGIYKKPNSEIIYAASSNKLFKVTPDSITILKSFPFSDEVFSWFPLNIGNKWVYKVRILDYNCFWVLDQWEESIAISKDTTINNLNYYKFEPPLANEYEFIRIDSINAKLKAIYSYADSVEVTIYDFLMEVGDTVLLDPTDPYGGFILMNEETQTIFNESRLIRNLMSLWFLPPPYTLLKGIGYFRDSFCEFGGHIRELKGCVINREIYGDTTYIVNVEEEQNLTPIEYKLEQNYPNPFNPSTKISWQSPVGSFTTLKIYDVLGNEVVTLVNEYREAGSHIVEFRIGNLELSSGIYFYQLKVGEYSNTKKMILLR